MQAEIANELNGFGQKTLLLSAIRTLAAHIRWNKRCTRQIYRLAKQWRQWALIDMNHPMRRRPRGTWSPASGRGEVKSRWSQSRHREKSRDRGGIFWCPYCCWFSFRLLLIKFSTHRQTSTRQWWEAFIGRNGTLAVCAWRLVNIGWVLCMPVWHCCRFTGGIIL